MSGLTPGNVSGIFHVEYSANYPKEPAVSLSAEIFDISALVSEARDAAKITPEQLAKPDTRTAANLFAADQWFRRHTVLMIHTETHSALGRFGLWEHRRIRDCRRLVREAEDSGPIVELYWVSGDWFLGEGRKPEPRKPDHEQRQLTIPLAALREGTYHSLEVGVSVFLAYGAIERVELSKDTIFAPQAGEDLLELPALMNVLPVLSDGTKRFIKMELSL
jgi:hypothetical protein